MYIVHMNEDKKNLIKSLFLTVTKTTNTICMLARFIVGTI